MLYPIIAAVIGAIALYEYAHKKGSSAPVVPASYPGFIGNVGTPHIAIGQLVNGFMATSPGDPTITDNTITLQGTVLALDSSGAHVQLTSVYNTTSVPTPQGLAVGQTVLTPANVWQPAS